MLAIRLGTPRPPATAPGSFVAKTPPGLVVVDRVGRSEESNAAGQVVRGWLVPAVGSLIVPRLLSGRRSRIDC